MSWVVRSRVFMDGHSLEAFDNPKRPDWPKFPKSRIVAETITDQHSSTSDAPATPVLASNEQRVANSAAGLWWIAALFVGLFIATFFLIAPKIQYNLDREVRARLSDAGIDPATLKLNWDYRNLTVTGYLPDDVSPEELSTILYGTAAPKSALFAEGVRHVRLFLDDGTFQSSGPGPTFKNSLSDESLSLSISSNSTTAALNGAVQTEAQREKLARAVIGTGVTYVQDNIEVMSIPATVAVNDRVDLLATILTQTGPAQAERCEITMNESGLYYRITALDKASALAIEQAAVNDISDFRITGGVDLISDYSFDLSAKADGESITLSGDIRSEEHRKRIVFAATEAIGGDNIVDQMILVQSNTNASESNAKVDSYAAVISRFARGIDGEVTLVGDNLVINANAGSEAVKEYLTAATEGARAVGLSVTENIRLQLELDDSQALQSELDQLIGEVRTNVVFESGTSELSAAAKQTLDKVAARINRYNGLLVEVEGHTDNVGRAVINEKLSQSRANAVRAYLSQRAIDGNRLIAVGYGHRSPIETNDTAEGRQANRRVHFTVLKQPKNVDG